ncbi:MAG TPA: DNA repair protein RadC [Syntrophomonadaceae bacterium]|nr:DNA repair protein RadC [Syntrophomonadaceae bacterium]
MVKDGFKWVSLRLVREKSVEYLSSVCTPEEAADILKPMLEDCDREKFIVLMLDTKNHAIAANTVSVGTVNSLLVHPREIYKAALLCNASAVILAHNHPSGDPTPSPEDIEITNRLNKAGEILGIEILDHIIIGDRTWISLKEKGLI